jgi:hypothetical protein
VFRLLQGWAQFIGAVGAQANQRNSQFAFFHAVQWIFNKWCKKYATAKAAKQAAVLPFKVLVVITGAKKMLRVGGR